MSWIFSKAFIIDNQILFYAFFGVIVIMILFAFIMANKEIKSDNK